jgi:hypothetical protein
MFNCFSSIILFSSALDVNDLQSLFHNLKLENAVMVLDGLTIFSIGLHAYFENDFHKMFFCHLSTSTSMKKDSAIDKYSEVER